MERTVEVKLTRPQTHSAGVVEKLSQFGFVLVGYCLFQKGENK